MLDILDHILLLEIVIFGAELQKVLRGHSANVDPLVLVSGLLEMVDDITIDPAVIPCPNMPDILDHSPLLEIVVLGAEPQKILRGHGANVEPLSL